MHITFEPQTKASLRCYYEWLNSLPLVSLVRPGFYAVLSVFLLVVRCAYIYFVFL